MDCQTKEQRSKNVSRIRKFGNESTEMRLVRLFRERESTGWRRHLKLPGRPGKPELGEGPLRQAGGYFKAGWVSVPHSRVWPAQVIAEHTTRKPMLSSRLPGS